eukprot:CAMPEP_0116573786 /NCGR_PEP_ID=MMETSP0397-20121206/18994_1 /TAXON_ID=216820 /ORGANISM="Cyclophora tenuis, Strain ECT3854" /LENGTH=108 /DNA_ID=CAMNT_0004102403 /DNA_START=8 /DNA_END=334 /DNA_ORIENTATION=-
MSCIILEQFVASPVIFATWDIPFPALMNNESCQRITSLVHGRIGRLLMENAKVWTIANVLIYNMPLEWRTAVSNVGNIFWNAIISTVTTEDIVATTPAQHCQGTANQE